MKIAFFFDGFYPYIDGVLTSTLTLMEALSKDGHEILIFAPKPKDKKRKKLPYAKIIWVPSVPARIYPNVYLGLLSLEVVRAFKKFDPDIVHITAPFSIGSLGLVLSKMYGIPSVAVFHGYFMSPEYLHIVGIKKGATFIGNLIWSFAKSFYNHSDYIVSPSNYVKKDMSEHGFEPRIAVCHNGFTPKKIQISVKKQNDFKDKYNIHSKRVGIYVGRLSKEKNIDTLLKVFQKVFLKVPDASLLIIGEGPIKLELQKLAQTLDIADKVIFTGAIEHDQLFEIGVHKLASLFVTCSTSEVQPMSLIEAMNMGLPLIVAKARGNTEMVADNGYVVDPKDFAGFANKITNIFQDDELREKMSLASEKRAKAYSSKASYACYLNLYQKALGNRQ